ncbi:MAG: heparinase [Alphaproteobacteria bacterium]|nr:heparinase [Alphaproteobacteria bacterium]
MGLNTIVDKLSAILPIFGERIEVPDRLAVRPVDAWSGDARVGALLFDGVFTKAGEHLALEGMGWEPHGVDESWVGHIHGFSWLRDLRAFANEGGLARGQSSAIAWMMIMAWIERYDDVRATRSLFYRADIAGERLSMWVSMFEFFSPERFEAAGDDEFHDAFFESVIRHGQHLARAVPARLSTQLYGLEALKAAKGLLYAGLAIEGCEDWRDQALSRLQLEINAQILSDGAHVSRNPERLLLSLQILLDVRGALASAGKRLPEFIQHAIDRIGPAVRFYRYNDRGFGLFHGGQRCATAFIDSILAQTGVRGKALESLPCAGFERVALGRALFVFDCGKVPNAPYHDCVNASPLAFEMNYAKHRIFVNCGSHPNDADWRSALSGIAAHNCLSLDGQEPSGSYAVRSSREDNKQACLLEAVHDGYMASHGVMHSRRVYICNDGNDIRGEDVLESHASMRNDIDVSIRFHLHPAVTVSLINNGQEALIRLPGGVGWRFKFHGGILSLEDSVYMGEGAQARKSKQLVIIGQVSDIYNQFKWCMRKEG